MVDNEFNALAGARGGRRIKNLKEAVQYAMHDARSHNLVKSFAKRRETVPNVVTEAYDEDKKGIEKRLEDSDKTLSELFRDGTELITNIRIANDKREVDRRIKEAELREELLDKLQNESIEARKKLDSLTVKWSEIEDVKDPMGMYESLESQKQRINELMEQKDQIIMECRKELDAADIRYIQDQEKQTADVQCLVERIDNQIEVMKRAYREHLELLEETITHERNELRKHACKKWEEMYENRAGNEEVKLRKEKDKREQYAQDIAELQQEHEELTRATRIRLEVDNQALEIELQKTKANVLLNSEKLDYNYQVLRKREDENIIIRNQQKRRLARLYESIATLRKKICDKTSSSTFEIEKLTAEVVKLHASIVDLEKKAELFTEINEKKYNALWQMNYENCLKQIDRVLSIDKTLTEQQLGLEWTGPDFELLEMADLPSYQNALKVIKDEQEKPVASKTISIVCRQESVKDVHTQRLLRQILQKISDKTEFLVEDKLFDLLKPYTVEEKTLVCLDNVFSALGIHKVDDINSLKDYFLPYAICQDCVSCSSSQRNPPMEYDVGDGVGNMKNYKTDDARNKDSDASSEENLKVVTFSDAESEYASSLESEFHKASKVEKILNCISNGHVILIDSSNVLEALREFAIVHTMTSEETATSINVEDRPAKMKSTISRLLSTPEVEQFWDRLSKVFTPEKEKVWQALEYGLTQYLKVLKEREELDTECEFLRNQNAELKHLLQKFAPNAVV